MCVEFDKWIFNDFAFLFLVQFITAVVILGVAAYANAGGYPVVDIVHSGVPVGHHGPALVNSWGHGHAGILGGGYGGYGGAGIGHHGLVVGSPHGAPHIALATTGSGHYGGDAHGHGHHDG